MYNTEKYDPDTVFTKLKNLRAYVKMAIRAKLMFEYPFTGFQLPKQNRRIEYLDENEFSTFKQYFDNHSFPEDSNRAISLRAFMFVCYTGLRLGDLYAVDHSNIRKGILRFEPQKNEADNLKTVEIPLHDYAKRLILTKKGKLFNLPSDTIVRQKLADTAIKLGISSTMSPHIGRHTFATRFLRHGGRLEVLKELLGHEKIETTMIYVHVDLERKIHEMKMIP